MNEPDSAPRSGAAASLTDWLVRDALPMWSRTGVDREFGGFFEKIDRDGQPVEEARRARVVARQIYVFATASRRGWLSGADALVEHGLSFLFDRMRLPDGTFAAAVRPDGSVVQRGFDLYEHAFVLFALAAARRGRPEREALRSEAEQLLQRLRAGWAHTRLGFEESNPRTLPLRSNPHMHLLEAALEWLDQSTGEAARPWQSLADEMVALCMTHFIDPRTGALGEHFDGEWQGWPCPSDARSQVVEPGHQFEWAWLLMRWAKRSARPDVLAAADQLLVIGERHGVDPSRGVAVSALCRDLQVTDACAKLWPQTERIKAWHAAMTLGNPEQAGIASEPLEQAVAGLSRYLLPSPAGLWHEVMREDGRFALQDCRASSLYHIVCAIDTVQSPNA